ncbi:hypothetical protein BGZ83_006911 [Gryganskiella cystojenkinii]|nr:hypothetical protein BGZ83_006911 [Gryganskiella cystojenkinii]
MNSLSISHNNTSPYAFSGRDLSRITVPREKRTRPYSIASGEAAMFQDYSRQVSSHCVDNNHDHVSSGRLSDPESTSSSARPSDRTDSKRIGGMVRDKEKEADWASSSSGVRANGLRSPTMKPANQMRVNLFNLVSTGYLPAHTLVVFREHSAIVTDKGTLIPQPTGNEPEVLVPLLQIEYETPSAWATAMIKAGRTGKVAVNGWSAIKISIHQDPALQKMFAGQGMAEISLDVLRKRYLADITEDGPDVLESQSNAPGANKDGALYDRKKRKRPSVRSAEKAALRISTNAENNSQDRSKGTDQGKRHQRKRTLSDLSGMVTSELFESRQLHLEAAGALFAMQDSSSSSTSKGKLRRSATITLESVARRRQELAATDKSASIPGLRMFKILSAASLSVSTILPTTCALLCIPAPIPIVKEEMTVEPIAEVLDRRSSPDDVREEDRKVTFKCHNCAVNHHVDCALVINKSTSTDGPWICARCSICNLCRISLHRPPTIESWHQPQHRIKKKSSSMDVDNSAAKDNIMAIEGKQDQQEQEQVAILTCNKCHGQTHLECQIAKEPSLEELFRLGDPATTGTSGTVPGGISWTCHSCRECIECGYHVPVIEKDDTEVDHADKNTKVKTGSSDLISDGDCDRLERTPIKRKAKNRHERESESPSRQQEGEWSQDFSLCPSCTNLSEKGNICPLCCRIYQDDDYETPMIFCDGCSLWVHVACDKGLEDRDYEELGEDSRQYFCPSCVPTPIPSPTLSSSSSVFSAFNSVDQSPWQGPMPNRGYFYSHQSNDSYNRDAASSGNEEDSWHSNNNSDRGYRSNREDCRKRKDDLLDLIKAAKEISDSEWSSSRMNSPSIASTNGTYSPMYPSASSNHSRTVSVSLESVAEVAAAEALLTIFSSGASTPISSTPYASYPPSPYEPALPGVNQLGFLPPMTLASPYESRPYYSVINSPQELPPLMTSMAVFTPSSDQESTTSASSSSFSSSAPSAPFSKESGMGGYRHAPQEDYFNRRSFHPPPSGLPPRGPIQYHQIGQELQLSPPSSISSSSVATTAAVNGSAFTSMESKEILVDSEDIIMEENDDSRQDVKDAPRHRGYSDLGSSTLGHRVAPLDPVID